MTISHFALYEIQLSHNPHWPHYVFYNFDTCLTMLNVNTCEWLESLNFNFAICIYLASFAILSWPILLGPIKTFKSHMLTFAYQNKLQKFPKMLNPWWLLVFKNDYDRQIDKVKLDMSQSMHTARGTRHVPKRWEMINEQLGENLLSHVTPTCLSSINYAHWLKFKNTMKIFLSGITAVL